MKKLACILTVLAMLSVSVLPSYSACFSDISCYLPDEIFNAVNYMSDNGYILGSGNGKFDPGQYITRAIAITVLYRFSGESREQGYAHPFTDVAKNTYYSKAVAWAYQRGISKGVSKSLFDPDSVLTREQLVCLLSNYAKYKGEYDECEQITRNGAISYKLKKRRRAHRILPDS